MYKIAFKLKQHTPLIHFQYEQHGATLRATELKPKMDKFLIQKLNLTETVIESKTKKETIVPKDKFINWFNNKDRLSLDYKVRINASKPIGDKMQEKNNRGKWYTKFPTFFANMGKESREELVNFSIFQDIEIIFTSFIQDLFNEINKHFAEFLAINNFGMRQSKGFGSFYIHPEDPKYKTVKENWFDYKTEITCDVKSGTRDYDTSFGKIEVLFKALRSGINLKEPLKRNGDSVFDKDGLMVMKDLLYMKPLIFLFFVKKDIQWEKKTIKEKFFHDDGFYHGKKKYNGLSTQKKNRPSSELLSTDFPEKRIIKDLLGLSMKENWRSYGTTISKTESKTDDTGKVLYDQNNPVDESEENRIDRFKSPLTIIPFESPKGFSIYFKFNEDLSIQGKWFNIKNSENKSFALQVAENFKLEDLFNFISDPNFNIEHYFDIYQENNRHVKFIKKALIETYSNLKKT